MEATANMDHGHDDHEEHLCDMESSKMGTWMFLATEVLLFGGLFALYALWRVSDAENFVAGSHHLNRIMGGINTVVLIVSSLTVVLGIAAIERGKDGLFRLLFLVTFVLGCVFMIIKYFEYGAKLESNPEGGFPFMLKELYRGENGELLHFFSLYFMMTCLHAIHVLIGMGMMVYCIILSKKGIVGKHRYNTVEVTGLYWHIVDIIWIFVFPLLYLL